MTLIVLAVALAGLMLALVAIGVGVHRAVSGGE